MSAVFSEKYDFFLIFIYIFVYLHVSYTREVEIGFTSSLDLGNFSRYVCLSVTVTDEFVFLGKTSALFVIIERGTI